MTAEDLAFIEGLSAGEKTWLADLRAASKQCELAGVRLLRAEAHVAEAGAVELAEVTAVRDARRVDLDALIGALDGNRPARIPPAA